MLYQRSRLSKGNVISKVKVISKVIVILKVKVIKYTGHEKANMVSRKVFI